MPKTPNIWGSEESQTYRESFNGIVETEAKIHQNELRLKPQFRGIEELLFRAELEVLMNEFKQRYVVHAIDYSYGDKARWVGEFVKQDRDYVLGELQKRLASLNIHADKDQLRLYFNRVSKAIKAKLARGEEVSSIPFTNGNYSGTRGKSKKKLQPKAGRKRAVMVDGQLFESISAANTATGKGYDYIQKSTLKALKKAQENSI